MKSEGGPHVSASPAPRPIVAQMALSARAGRGRAPFRARCATCSPSSRLPSRRRPVASLIPAAGFPEGQRVAAKKDIVDSRPAPGRSWPRRRTSCPWAAAAEPDHPRGASRKGLSQPLAPARLLQDDKHPFVAGRDERDTARPSWSSSSTNLRTHVSRRPRSGSFPDRGAAGRRGPSTRWWSGMMKYYNPREPLRPSPTRPRPRKRSRMPSQVSCIGGGTGGAPGGDPVGRGASAHRPQVRHHELAGAPDAAIGRSWRLTGSSASWLASSPPSASMG